MSKTNQFTAIMNELRRCGEILIGISDALRDLQNGTDESNAAGNARETECSVPRLNEQEANEPALADVRALLAEKSRDGYTAQVRAIILAHGADKLSEIDPAEFPAIMKEAEVLGNG